MAQRQVITLRLTEAGITWLNGLAVENNLTRTQVIRAALAVAQKHETEFNAALALMEPRL